MTDYADADTDADTGDADYLNTDCNYTDIDAAMAMAMLLPCDSLAGKRKKKMLNPILESYCEEIHHSHSHEIEMD